MYLYHYFVIAGGMILGLILLGMLNKNDSKKKKEKVEVDDERTTLKEQDQQQKEDQYQKEEQKKNESYNNNDDIEALRQRKIESDERKNKIFKNLSEKDRQLVEDYFKQQAKQYITGEVSPADRRAAKLIQIIKFSLYVLFGMAVYISLTIAFNTTSPLMIIENIKHLVRTFLSQLFGKH